MRDINRRLLTLAGNVECVLIDYAQKRFHEAHKGVSDKLSFIGLIKHLLGRR